MVKEELKKIAAKQDKLVEQILEDYRTQFKKDFSDEIVNAYDMYADIATRQQKRLRSSFIYFAHKLLNGTSEEVALKVGAVVELIHSYILIQDDFMDKSKIRRGLPTIHEEIKNNLKIETPNIDKIHISNSLAANVGLIGSHLAMHYFSQIELDPKIKNEVLKVISLSYVVTAFGQYSDILNTTKGSIKDEDILKTLEYKTGVYTYGNPISAGAVLAGASKEELEILNQYAIPGGISFQIIDDILGTFGEPDETGKSNIEDIMEGKMTLLAAYALQKGTPEQVEKLRKALGNDNLTESDYEEMKQIMIETGALEFSKQKAQELADQALKALDNPLTEGWDQDALKWFRELPTFILNREK